jgi:hypothetical protein
MGGDYYDRSYQSKQPKNAMTTQNPFKVSRGFLGVLGAFSLMTIALNPALKFTREIYDNHKASTIIFNIDSNIDS